MAEPITVIVEDEDDSVVIDPMTGALEVKQPGGGVLVNLDDHRVKKTNDDDPWFANLANDIDPMKLSTIANDLYDAIEADDRSRAGYLANRAKGLDLCGLKLEEPRSVVSESASGIDGMSSVTNPLLLEAILKGWANAQAELLPANGPVKVKDDGAETQAEDDLAEAFERGMNHYLTKTAREYYPDTSHMLLWGTHLGGSGFKKVYRCPMRRRPVSDSVDCKDLIVSDTSKDFGTCARITHQIEMRPSVMKRMQLLGAYREVTLTQPTPVVNQVQSKEAAIQGTSAQKERPEDQPYTVWETQCELDLPDYAPGKFKDKHVPLPYLVSMDKDSREILAIRRDWDEDDEECERKRMFVKFPYVPGPGFYGTGMIGILGNATAAMTAAWREALDAGMFASFPGGLIAKLAGRQNTSNFKVAPGEFAAIETNNMPINAVAMPMPYRDVTPGLMNLIDKISGQAKEVGGTAEIPVQEGVANVPVGTILAAIEQAAKIMAAAHKGMHTAQSEEIELIADLFRIHPEDFFKSNKEAPSGYWNEQKLLTALQNTQLVPVSDPNVPSHVHRIGKAVALVQLFQLFPQKLNPDEVLTRCLRAMKEDPTGLLIPAEVAAANPPPPDPKFAQAQAQTAAAEAKKAEAQSKLEMIPIEMQMKVADLQTKRDVAASNIIKENIIHQNDAARLQHEMSTERNAANLEQAKAVADAGQAARAHALDVASFGHDQDMAHAAHGLAVSEHLADRQHAEREHGLAVSEHLHEREHAQHEREMAKKEHDLAWYEAKHPPKPAASKPKRSKK